MWVVSSLLDKWFSKRLKSRSYRERVYRDALQQRLRHSRLGVALLRNLNQLMSERPELHTELADMLKGVPYQQAFWESDFGYLWYTGNLGVDNPSFREAVRCIMDASYTSHLDVGCGWGELSQKVSQLTNAERIVGIDISEELIRNAKRLHGNKKVLFYCTDLMNVDTQYDLVTVFGSTDYMPPDKFSGAMRKLLQITRKELLITNSLRKIPFQDAMNLEKAVEIKRYDVGYVQPVNAILKELQQEFKFNYSVSKHGTDSILAKIKFD